MQVRELDKTRIETRTMRVEFDERSEADPRIKGHAAVFDRWSEDLGGFKERILPGAFTKTLGEADVRMLWDHNSQYVLGRTSAGTLQLLEDTKGLYFEDSPPDTTWYRDLAVSMKRGDVSQMSFGFQVVKDRWNDDYTKRELLEVRLLEVSVVTFPAYPQTSAKVRALPNGINLDRVAEIIRKREEGGELDIQEMDELRAAADYIHPPRTEPPSGTPVQDEPRLRTRFLADMAVVEAILALEGACDVQETR